MGGDQDCRWEGGFSCPGEIQALQGEVFPSSCVEHRKEAGLCLMGEVYLIVVR